MYTTALRVAEGTYEPGSLRTESFVLVSGVGLYGGFAGNKNGRQYRGRINMGAYGGTEQAIKSYFGTAPCETIMAGDINGDCKVDFVDFAIFANEWLWEE